MVEKRLENLEEAVTDVKVSMAGMTMAVDGIGKTLATLVDVRSETLHLVKSQDEARGERDEIFKRLRVIEAGREGCIANQRHTNLAIKHITKDVSGLKEWKTAHASMQKAAEKAGAQAGEQAGRFWGALIGGGALFVSVVTLILKMTGHI